MTLVELLEIWRTTRDPRAADAIDRASAAVTARTTPITATTVKIRTLDWLTIARRQDPDDVGRLAVVPFPRTIKALADVIAILLAWPDDPRIAQLLTTFLEQGTLDTGAGYTLGRRAAKRIAAIGDVRAIPRLRAISSGRMAFLEEIATLEKVVPKSAELPVDEDDALIAQIYAAPNDPEPVNVYGDWLSEREDPRGEFIALQLATTRTDDGERRERELIATRGATWAGALGRRFADEGRIFERGFFAGGKLLLDATTDLDDMLEDPAWALIRAIECSSPRIVELLERLPHLRVLATGHHVERHPSLRELHQGVAGDIAHLAECGGLPALRVLGIWGTARLLPEFCATAPVIARLERICLYQPGQGVFGALAARGGVREIEILEQTTRLHGDTEWIVRLARDTAPGPFTRVVATRRGNPSLSSLMQKLDRIPATWPLSVTIDSPKLMFKSDEHEQIEAQLARFTNATSIVTPWPRIAVVSDEPVALIASIEAPGLTNLEALWPLLDEIGPFDTFAVNSNTTQRPLGKKPVAKLTEWLHKDKNRLYRTRLDRTGSNASCELSSTIEVSIVREGRSDADLAAWFVRLVEACPPTRGRCHVPSGQVTGVSYCDGIAWLFPGWLHVVDRMIDPYVDRAALAALPDVTILSAAPLVVSLGATPADATVERTTSFAQALGALAIAGFQRANGFVFPDEVRLVFDELARELGLPLVVAHAWRVEYRRAAVVLHVSLTCDTSSMSATLYSPNDSRDSTFFKSVVVATRDELVAQLASIYDAVAARRAWVTSLLAASPR